jgi:Ca-activated chloride channel family protein
MKKFRVRSESSAYPPGSEKLKRKGAFYMSTNRKTISIFALLMSASMLFTGCGAHPSGAPSSASYTGSSDGRNDTYYEYQADNAAEDYKPDYIYDQDITVSDNEEYSVINESGFKSVKADPLSTFSVDVDTASYANVRRIIQSGNKVNPDAVRIEEMLNYFHYDYPQPKSGEPFSVNTQITDCPWNSDTKLMRVGLHAKDIDFTEREPMNLVFLIDVSGSMYDADKLPLVQKSFSVLADELDERDRISIVTYAGTDSVVLDGVSGESRDKILSAIYSLEAGGSTAGAAGISTAYEIAEKHFIEGGNNRIILATDGDLNVGISSESELKRLVEKKCKSGVYLSVLGFGTGNIKDNKMETLADNGNGNYSYIDSINEAKKVLVDEMGGTLVTVAKDVKIQVEFNPAYIKGYRLVGYENRALSAEDFSDDSKDAGEVGAGHSVTALYEVAFADSEMKFDSSDLKYSSDEEGKDNGEYLTVSVRYKEPDEDESRLLTYPVTFGAYSEKMDDDMRFAAAVAEFGMILRDSDNKGTATRGSVLEMLDETDLKGDKYKTEFKELVKDSVI